MMPRALLAPALVLVTLACTCVSPTPAPGSSASSAGASPAGTAARSSSSSPAAATLAPAPPSLPIPSRAGLRPGALVWQMPGRATCAGAYQAPTARGAVGDPALLEASGLVASPAQEGVLWTHNDSGDSARLFALATDGRALGTYALPHVDAVDIEDLAAGPCPDLSGPCLYVADTGDNRLRREQLVVYAVPEPLVTPDRPLARGAEAPFVWIFPLVIPERANIEALVVLPDATAMLLFEKTEGEVARVFRYAAPWTPVMPATVEVVGALSIPAALPALRQITGADVHPTGERVLLRSYSSVWEATLNLVEGRPTLAALREVLSGIDEPQGEAVAYDAAGTGIWTLSESPSGQAGPPLHHAACTATP